MAKLPRFRRVQKLVAVAWDQQELLAAIATRIGNTFQLDDVICVPLDRADSLSDAGARLAEELRHRHVTSYQLLVGLPRSQVEMLSVQVPPAKREELPTLVHNEVFRQVTDLPDDAVIDFILPDQTAVGSAMMVEAAILRPDTKGLVDQVSHSLGQPPAQIAIRSLAVASLFARQLKKLPPHSLLINLMKYTVDLSVMSRNQITFSRSVHLAVNQDQEFEMGPLADEIRRTLFVAPRPAFLDEDEDSGGVQHVYMFADRCRDSPFVENLAEELQLPVSLLDPLTGISKRAETLPDGMHRFAALIGMIRDFIDGTTRIDLANPKRPPAPVRVGRKAVIYAAAACIALVLVVGTLKRELDSQARAVEELTANVKNHRQLLKKLAAKTAVIDAVKQWESSEVNWLDELRTLSDHFPPADQAVVQRMSMAPTTGARGLISMSVRVRNPAIIADMEKNVRDEAHQVRSQRISQSGTAENFSCQFETSVVVTPRKNDPRLANPELQSPR